MLGGLTMCELSVDDREQQSGQYEVDRNRCDDWNDRAENWAQNEITNGHQIENWVQDELTDGDKSWKNRMRRRSGIQNKLTEQSQHRVSWASRGKSDRTEDTDKLRLEPTRQPGTRKPEYSIRRLASLLCGTRVDVCLCPLVQKAKS